VSGDTLGQVGVWLLIGSAAVIAGEFVVAAVFSMRMARQARRLAIYMEREQAAIRDDVERLRAAMEETRRLWRPYARVLRWLRHPLVVALFESYMRRRAVG
jgi:hypothetical protein